MKTTRVFLKGMLSDLTAKVASRFKKNQEDTTSQPIILTQSTANDDALFSYVKDKMHQMENEAVLQRMKFLEKVIQHLTFEMRRNNEENKFLREMVLHMSTNVEELLNATSFVQQHPHSTRQQTPANNTEDGEESLGWADDDAIEESFDGEETPTAKKLRLN